MWLTFTFILNTRPACPHKTLATTYQATWYHNAQQHSINIHRLQTSYHVRFPAERLLSHSHVQYIRKGETTDVNKGPKLYSTHTGTNCLMDKWFFVIYSGTLILKCKWILRVCEGHPERECSATNVRRSGDSTLVYSITWWSSTSINRNVQHGMYGQLFIRNA